MKLHKMKIEDFSSFWAPVTKTEIENFKNKFANFLHDCNDNTLSEYFQGEWLQRRNFIQPLMSVDLHHGVDKDVVVEDIALSDSGSSLAFVTKKLVSKACLSPAGIWRGVIQTLYSDK